VLLSDVVATSAAVATTTSRTAKRDGLAELLARLEPDEVEAVVGFLVGEPRQGRIGVGGRTLASIEHRSAAVPTLTVHDVDRAVSALADMNGPGSASARATLLEELLGRATPAESRFVRSLLTGELRQGALAGVMTDAVARASAVPSAAIRRAVMLGGGLGSVAGLALDGGPGALAEVGLVLGRPLQPMLASTAPSVRDAVESIGLASVEWKLDGIRIQVHRDGDRVRVWTRNLNEITARVPAVVEQVLALEADRLVLDGEAIGMDATGRPQLFQDTVSRRGRRSGATHGDTPTPAASAPGGDDRGDHELRPFFFDVLHSAGVDLIDRPLAERLEALTGLVDRLRMPGVVTDDPAVAEAALAEALAAGHEGVVVKAAGSTYEAGRRGRTWRKVKPVHTLDLVVLAAEWGHGRRRGWLSNLHLGARADDGSGFVMVGKTFKGLTDELLRWQTDRFRQLAEREEPWDGPGTGVVWLRPAQVVEVALDGVQRSTRYPGGVALRFARVLRYRHDKAAQEADTLSAVHSMLASGALASGDGPS
jgi:DNA ligase 1